MQPLHELLNREVDVDALIQHLDNIYHYFSQYCMKVSCSDGVPVDEQEVICQYWIDRIKQLFEDLKKWKLRIPEKNLVFSLGFYSICKPDFQPDLTTKQPE